MEVRMLVDVNRYVNCDKNNDISFIGKETVNPW